jgi:hypothetical protein
VWSAGAECGDGEGGRRRGEDEDEKIGRNGDHGWTMDRHQPDIWGLT